RLPPRDASHGQVDRRAVRWDRGEVAVVAGEPDRGSDRGIDGPIRQPGASQARGDRLREERADPDLTPRLAIDVAQLAVVAEPARGFIDRIDDPIDRSLGRHAAARPRPDQPPRRYPHPA